MRYLVTIQVSVEAISEEAAINIVEDAVNSYKSADIEVVESEAEEAV